MRKVLIENFLNLINIRKATGNKVCLFVMRKFKSSTT